MAQLADFSPGQINEARTWFEANFPELWFSYSHNASTLFDVYFKLKRIPIRLSTKEFIIGVEYENKEDVIAGKELVNISFRNPHVPEGTADQFAKQLLIAKLSTL